ERANRTHTEEFYEVVDSDFNIADLTPKLLEWEHVYNTVRPHQALGYLTPQQFLQCYRENRRKEVMCH
ncbi:MAG: integrase core domain-containing protein, partial [Chloroflexota bacterium]